jgi:hypothetical protein
VKKLGVQLFEKTLHLPVLAEYFECALLVLFQIQLAVETLFVSVNQSCHHFQMIRFLRFLAGAHPVTAFSVLTLECTLSELD